MKRHKGRVSHVPVITNVKHLGQLRIISEEAGRITVAQIKSLILTLKRKLPYGSTIIPRINANITVTKKPLEVRMGKGKGNIVEKIARVRPNTIILEIAKIREVVPIKQYLLALRSAVSKLPILTKIKSLDYMGEERMRIRRLELLLSTWKAESLPVNIYTLIFQLQVPLALPCYDFLKIS